MANQELALLNSVAKNKDIDVLFGQSVDDLLVNYGDVWQWTKKYYTKYRAIPDIEVIIENFPDVEEIDARSPAPYYLDELRNEFLKNRMELIITNRAVELSSGTDPIVVMSKLQKSLNRLGKYSSSVKDINIMDFSEAEQYYDNLREKSAAMGGVPGIPTGISFIDSACPRGMQGGDVISVIGYPARGKSALSSLLSANAYARGFKPMIVSLEMSADAVRDRVYTVMGSGLFRNSDLMVGNYDTDNFRTFSDSLAGRPEFIVVDGEQGGGAITPGVIQARIDQHKPSIVILDYLQLMMNNAHSQDMTSRMRDLSMEIKELARTNSIPIVVISSATPDGTSNITEPPNVEKSAWSRQIAYDSTMCMAIHRHDGTNIFEMVCAKNRYGPLWSGYLDWDIDNGIIIEKFDL